MQKKNLDFRKKWQRQILLVKNFIKDMKSTFYAFEKYEKVLKGP